jgi:hypothetical protein
MPLSLSSRTASALAGPIGRFRRCLDNISLIGEVILRSVSVFEALRGRSRGRHPGESEIRSQQAG